MNEMAIKITATDKRDGMRPVWKWQVTRDGRLVGEGLEPFFPQALDRARDSAAYAAA